MEINKKKGRRRNEEGDEREKMMEWKDRWKKKRGGRLGEGWEGVRGGMGRGEGRGRRR